jgi:tellurite resistance protein TerC
VPAIPIWLSLAFILGTLAITTVASLLKVRRSPEAEIDLPAEHAAEESVPEETTEPR